MVFVFDFAVTLGTLTAGSTAIVLRLRHTSIIYSKEAKMINCRKSAKIINKIREKLMVA